MAESWVNSAAGTGTDLHLNLVGPGGQRVRLIRALRAAIRSGRLAPGTRLPPYRSLAADLGLARNTVAEAYAELVAEGWLTARQGSGTSVAPRATPRRAPARRATPTRVSQPTFDLRQGRPDVTRFPRAEWLAATRRALARAPHDAFGPGDPQGRRELRVALADYLARARGVRTDPDLIVICSGFSPGLRLLFGPVLSGPLAVESYGLWYHREVLAANGIRTVPVPVDADGADISALPATGARTVLLTPAHQFPTGGTLHPARRAAVIDWANTGNGLIVEDDYDGEFRYDRQPVGAVQGLEPNRVLYVGSISKSLSPALRIGWLVVPPGLVDDVLRAKGPREFWCGALDQLALAEFIESGGYDRHVRRMRQHYRRRRDQLVATLAERAPAVRVSGIAAGLHAVLELPAGMEAAVVAGARWQGLALDGLAPFRHPQATTPHTDGLVVGYATPPEHLFAEALDALCGTLPG